MKTGDKVYYIVSGQQIRPAILKGMPAGKCLLSYGSGLICLPPSRVFASREEAEARLAPQPEAGIHSSALLLSNSDMRWAYDHCGKP